MYKTFIAGVTALSLTMTSAAPASARGIDEEQLGQILFGLFATAAIAKLVQNHGQTDARPKATAPVQPQVTPRHNSHRADETPRTRRQARKILPHRCIRAISVGTDEVKMFTRRCIARHYAFQPDFPRRCEISLPTRDGRRSGWVARCMRQAGFRSDRNR